jgi:hypothetical protein
MSKPRITSSTIPQTHRRRRLGVPVFDAEDEASLPSKSQFAIPSSSNNAWLILYSEEELLKNNAGFETPANRSFHFSLRASRLICAVMSVQD